MQHNFRQSIDEVESMSRSYTIIILRHILVFIILDIMIGPCTVQIQFILVWKIISSSWFCYHQVGFNIVLQILMTRHRDNDHGNDHPLSHLHHLLLPLIHLLLLLRLCLLHSPICRNFPLHFSSASALIVNPVVPFFYKMLEILAKIIKTNLNQFICIVSFSHLI